MKGIKKICVWSARYIHVFIAIITLSFVLQWLFSYLPLFVQFSFKVLANEPNDVALPGFLIDWYNSFGDTLTIVLMVGISMIALQAVRSIMRFIDNYLQGALSHYISHKMRIKIYEHVCNLPYTFHNNADIGDLIQRSTSDVDQVADFVSKHVPSFINIFITIGIGAFQVYQISPTLMWVSLAIIPVTAVSSVVYFRYCNKRFDIIEKAESKMTTIIQENVNGARVVRAFSNEKYEFEKMDKASKEFAKKTRGFNLVMAFFWGFSDLMVFVQYLLTLGCGIYLAKENIVDSADITAALLLMNMLIWPMRGLGRTIASFGKASVAANRISDILEQKSEFECNGELNPAIDGEIEFKNVSFSFEDTKLEVLNNISFKIEKGKTIAIVGKTGSGKSTICNMLTRMLEASSGEILIDGVNILDIEKKYLRSKIKYILQEPFLFSKTIYENIAITNSNMSNTDVYRVAQIAAIHDEINKFELGYNTIVGEKGTTLSGGQKQRVAIARMLASDSPVIIFDDSLSALDTKTDLMIRKALKQKNNNQTMIIITHRTTTAKDADVILVLDDGKVSQMGTHDELIKEDGLYLDLWGIQGELEAEFNKLLKEVD